MVKKVHFYKNFTDEAVYTLQISHQEGSCRRRVDIDKDVERVVHEEALFGELRAVRVDDGPPSPPARPVRMPVECCDSQSHAQGRESEPAYSCGSCCRDL